MGKREGVILKSFDQVIKEADILTLHIPGNKDKSPIISEKELYKMKHGSFLINISRVGVIDKIALYNALVNK
jgi:D-3-phosphoglycerate dehydrogenase